MVGALSHAPPVTAQLSRWQGAHPSGLRDPNPCSLGDRPGTLACLLSVLGTSVDATLCPATLDGFFLGGGCVSEKPLSLMLSPVNRKELFGEKPDWDPDGM